MKDRPVSGEINYEQLADKTENFVASDIAYIVNDAATRAFEDDVDITQELLEEVIKENNPSVSSKDLKFYEEMRKNMESSGKEPERPRIGFV
jgi:transitional endoplasmic reticulum ATPase